MTTRTGGVAPLLVLFLTLVASCGGDEGAMHATLTDDACTYDGSTTTPSGRFSIEIENATFRFGSFGVVALYEDEEVDEIALVKERVASRRLLRERARSDVPPPYGRWVAGADVGPTTRTFLPVDAGAGRYAVVCYVHGNADERLSSSEIAPPERAHVATQLEVTGTSAYP